MADAPVTLRDLRPDDHAVIAAILAAIPAFRPEEAELALELLDETLHPRPDTDYEWLIAVVVDRVVGFACYGPVPLTEGTFDLYWIAVDPSTVRRGVAARLDAAVTARLRSRPGARWLLAETSSTPAYAPARAFYTHRGYALVSRLTDYYRVGDDRLTFGKRLDGNGLHVSD